MIYAFSLSFFVQKSFLTKTFLLFAEINLTTGVHSILVLFLLLQAIEKLHAAELFDELSSLSQRHLLATGDAPSTTLNKNTSDIMIYASKVVLSTVNGPMIGANFDIKGSGNARQV